ncbi:MAG: tetratricopeptide repeat protein [Bryobacteraceae bacterium]|jgi:tetratricopeptide (TPR) repeat protein
MRSRYIILITAMLVASVALVERLAAERPANITVDYPAEGSIFPPDIAAPTFLWRDANPEASAWRIEVRFADGAKPLKVKAPGPLMKVGEIDPRAVGETNQPPTLTPEQAAAHTWSPDAATWEAIKRHSVSGAATVTITGLANQQPVSEGRVAVRTSKDPVGAPIFYRDVPLMPSETQQGVIKPLATSALPLIAWRLRNISETRSRVALTGMHTCANCHSFSLDGKTMGMDLDGPQNDKGLYGVVPVKAQMSIGNADVISWRPRYEKPALSDRVGFMSQVSPDGKYILTRLNGPEANFRSTYFITNFKDYRFLQVFYPTRGILAWYDRATGQVRPLPGADDARYAQTDGVWSPDGKFVVFARAEGKDPFPEGWKQAEFANDPNEPQIQYDLYRVPFNGGQGGPPEPIAGAARNGMSNNFPKVSPDGRWIVFVQNRNGQLMRPDSQLYIVPAAGGTARRMRCNTPLMNSWHSFSPNGRWLVFSSKSRSPYTQMFLTHIDEDGNDSPAILIENSTAANRAVNIPEFVNIPPDTPMKIEVPAADYYRQYDVAAELAGKGQWEASLPEWTKAIELNPDDARAEMGLGSALAQTGRTGEAIAHYQRAREMDPGNPGPYAQLGVTLARMGRFDEAIPDLEKALAINPGDAGSQRNLCAALAMIAGRSGEAIARCSASLEAEPGDAQLHANLAIALTSAGRVDEAISHLEKAAQIMPDNATIQGNLGAALAQGGRIAEAIPHFEGFLRMVPGSADGHYALGSLYSMQGRTADALAQWGAVLRLDPNHVAALNQRARVLAAGPDGARNGAEAVELAERAVRLTGGQEALVLDTLAAALAEAGRFAEAVDTERRAVALARQHNNAQLVETLNGRIALYEARTPLRAR